MLVKNYIGLKPELHLVRMMWFSDYRQGTKGSHKNNILSRSALTDPGMGKTMLMTFKSKKLYD